MRIIFVPDVHGRTFWTKCEPFLDKCDGVVFAGDYLDPYPDGGKVKGADEMMENLGEIVEFKKDNPEDVTLLIGNHDLHYIVDEPMCTRFDYVNRARYHRFFEENAGLFDVCKMLDDTLFTHAGVAEEWGNRHGITADGVVGELEALYKDDVWSFAETGLLRGGELLSGSPVWSDVREAKRRDWFQVFGHTRATRPIVDEDFACLDCGRIFAIDTLLHKAYNLASNPV